MGKILIVILASLFLLSGCNNNQSDNNADNSQSGSKISTDININISKEDGSNVISEKSKEQEQKKEPVETDLSSFSTKILSNGSSRVNNIKITCNSLNGHVIKSGETFSFNGIVGKSTTDKGYKEADVIINGKKEKGLGGGNCQVSSTIYNAALSANGATIVERHPHGKPVSYVEKDHDAAISYGSMDLKFKNDTSSDMKLYVSCDDKSVTARLVSISY